jgi:pheromone shutdown-related protein TraB
VGTAHISAASVAEVREVIAREQPRVVAVELDQARYGALTEPDQWKQTRLVDVIRQGKAFLLLAQAFLASYQRRLGEQFGVQPGAEMLAAIEEAKAKDMQLVLADRDIGVTLRRAWGRMGLREKFRITWEFMKALTGAAEAMDAPKDGKKGEAPLNPDDLLKEDALSLMMDELSAFAPSVSDVLVKERDAYLAGKIRAAAAEAGEGKVVAVIGAGHLKGVQAHLQAPQGIPAAETLETLPQKFPTGKAIAWALMVLVLGAFAWLGWRGMQTGNFAALQDALLQWTLITGGFSAIGAALALAHPVSIAVAFVAAPFATIHPLIATGWFSGLSEAWLRQPTVGDYEGLSKMRGVRDFWRNRVTRVLLVAALTNLGAMVGTTYMLPVLSRLIFQG